MAGSFVISLDFELYWGVFDKLDKEIYGNNIKAVHQIVPKLLDLFDEFEIATTWATVGFLLCKNKPELLELQPKDKPKYSIESYSSYAHMSNVGIDYLEDPLHYCGDLIEKILSYKNQELGSHTFSHYYCLEQGQNEDSFQADSIAFNKAANKFNVQARSLVFPRNQFNPSYLEISKQNGILTYRGNQKSWIYKEQSDSKKNYLKRLCRLLNNYLPLTNDQSIPKTEIAQSDPINIPATRFLRPYNKRLSFLEKMRLSRIKNEMTVAAEKGNLYHLWWHPHNFGANQKDNFNFLKELLIHYQFLNQKFGFKSRNMTQLASEIINERT